MHQFLLQTGRSLLNLSRGLNSASVPSKFLHTSTSLWAEPLKKKRKIDPAIIKAREERRKKKIERAIKILARNERKLKPIEEVDVSREMLEQKGERQRERLLSAEKWEEFELMKKQWCRIMNKQHCADLKMFSRILRCQEKALQELRLESEELYKAAVQIDEKLVPFTFIGPTDTAPIENYDSPDGDYADVSKKWE